MKSLQQITSKLSIQNVDLRYHYLINDVSVGLELALRHKKIIKNKDTYNRLNKLNSQAKKLPMSIWKGIDLENQLTAYHIGLDALEIIEQMI